MREKLQPLTFRMLSFNTTREPEGSKDPGGSADDFHIQQHPEYLIGIWILLL